MKIQKIIYWVTTVFFCSWMVLNAYFYLTSEEAKQLCRHFGFPDYFRVELAFAKIIGVILLLLPAIKGRIKEWVYSGFVITVISGFVAHVCSRDSFQSSLSALVALAILLTSYFSYNNLKHI
ncbi:DoxX-like family protein [Chryseobacterium soldanellicola]|uniref:DoxX-like family protein n=1 Tax=Chryseobacterium soldanellicola TaxID=311333 RepID=A0A1H1FT27_9FLAO|nr:DoxX family protein [Chryseobacterium soldanellicola]SDR04084.1 DoxX-like family protein [Chryseobacterium soldanellicola]